MPLQKISGEDAIRNIRSNPYGEWPSREPADANRIEPVCKPAFRPSFKLSRDDRIFAMGSCFARFIERELAYRGFDVVTDQSAWPDVLHEESATELLNNYGIFSMVNELQWALDPATPFNPEANIFELAPNRYCDVHLPLMRPGPLERVLSYRRTVREVTRRVTDCRVVIMTLGLSESWFDTVSQSYLNAGPPRTLVARFPGRFEVHVLSFEDTIKALQRTLALLRTYCRSDQKILLTVSPVPLGKTHTDRDVLVANSYSKAVLRTAAEHVAALSPNVDYFPSFESVMLSERSRAWLDDQVHVQPELVRVNVERMVEAYKPEAEETDEKQIQLALSDAEEEVSANNLLEAIRLLEPLRHSARQDLRFVCLFVEVCLRLGRVDDAKSAIEELSSDLEDWRYQMLRGQVVLNEGDQAGILILERLLKERPKCVPIMRSLLDAYVGIDRLDDALVVARQWSQVAPANTEPLRRAAAIHRRRGDHGGAEAAFKAAFMRPPRTIVYLDYIDFLIELKRVDEAAKALALLKPESRAHFARCERLRAFLPSAQGQSERTPQA